MKILLFIFILLVLIFIIIFSCSQYEERFIDMEFNFDKLNNYSPQACHEYWNNHQHNSVLVIIENNKYQIKYNKILKDDEKLLRFLDFMKMLQFKLPDCTFVQSFSDIYIENDCVLLHNSINKNQKGLLSPYWFMISESKIESVKNDNSLWEINKAVWRGSRTGNHEQIWNSRRHIVDKSKDFPNIIDAEFVDLEKNLNSLKTTEHLKYRFIISKDGNGGTYGLYWQLMSGRHVLLNTNFKQWFSPYFENNIHFTEYNDENSGNDNIISIIKETPIDISLKIAQTCKKQAMKIINRNFIINYMKALLHEIHINQFIQ